MIRSDRVSPVRLRYLITPGVLDAGRLCFDGPIRPVGVRLPESKSPKWRGGARVRARRLGSNIRTTHVRPPDASSRPEGRSHAGMTAWPRCATSSARAGIMAAA
jgi:hypothetical protein